MNEATVAAHPRRRGFRFGLRTLFVVVTVLCVSSDENVQVGDLHVRDTIFRWQDGAPHG